MFFYWFKLKSHFGYFCKWIYLFDVYFFVGVFRADPFAKKDWYDIKAPSVFTTRNVGKTLVTRTQGTKVCFFKLFISLTLLKILYFYVM